MALPEDLAPALTDGVVLCHLANHVKPRSVASIHVPSPAVVSVFRRQKATILGYWTRNDHNLQPKLTMARCRRNVDNFLEACRKIGVDEVSTIIRYLFSNSFSNSCLAYVYCCGPAACVKQRTSSHRVLLRGTKSSFFVSLFCCPTNFSPWRLYSRHVLRTRSCLSMSWKRGQVRHKENLKRFERKIEGSIDIRAIVDRTPLGKAVTNASTAAGTFVHVISNNY